MPQIANSPFDRNRRNPNITAAQSSIDLATVVRILKGRWYVFATCITIALVIAVVHIYRTPSSYLQKATVLVKDSKSGSTSGVEAFADISGVAGLLNSNVENEQLILQSRSVMEAVVKHLSLQYFYYQPKPLRYDELYDLSPIEIVPTQPDAPIEITTFKLSFLDNDSTRLEYNSKDTTFMVNIGEEMEFPALGKVTVKVKPQTRDWYLQECGQEVKVNAVDLQNAISYYLSNLGVELVQKDASMISLSYVSTSPRKAADILNMLIEEYSLSTIHSKNEVLESSQDFIGSRLQIIAAELSEVDGRIESYKRSEKTAAPMDEAKSYLSRADDLDEQIAEYEIQLHLIRELRTFMDDHKDFEILPYNIGINNQALNSQITSYNDLLVRYRRLLSASSEKSPVVGDNATALRSMLATIKQTAADMQRSIEMNLSESRQMNHKNVSRVDAANSNLRALTSIERDQKIKSELYTYLLQKSEENAIMKSMTESNIRPIDMANGDLLPIGPRKGRILIVAFLLGLLLPFVYYYVRDLIYTKVRGRSDVSPVLQAPIVGEIPSKPKERARQTIFVEPGATNQISEAFRILRTNLKFLALDEKLQVIALTSTMPGEGKSYVSANLAMTFALSGKRVCLLDLDLRKMSTTRFYKLRGKHGLSEFLANTESDIVSLVQPTEYENVSILPGGIIPPNPAELLMSDRFDIAINELRKHFDYLILDNPPFDVVADTGISNRVVDVTLYVMRMGVFDRRELPVIQEIYEQKKLRNMAMVLTDVDYEALVYSLGYKGYGKSYGYRGYGYSYYGETHRVHHTSADSAKK